MTPKEKRAKHAAYMKAYYARNGRKRDKKKASAYSAEYRKKNRAKIRVVQRRWLAKKAIEDPGYISRSDAKCYRTRRRFGVYLKYHYGMTIEEYESIHASQGGLCAICKETGVEDRKSGPRRLAVDHCHTTGKVRGLLCLKCNRGIGNLRDDPELVAAALVYLKDRQPGKQEDSATAGLV